MLLYRLMLNLALAFFVIALVAAALGLGGVARTSQVGLAMPLLGLVWAALFLGERLDLSTLLAGGLVSVFAFLGNASPRASEPS